jgi:hypothetical protein
MMRTLRTLLQPPLDTRGELIGRGRVGVLVEKFSNRSLHRLHRHR